MSNLAVSQRSTSHQPRCHRHRHRNRDQYFPGNPGGARTDSTTRSRGRSAGTNGAHVLPARADVRRPVPAELRALQQSTPTQRVLRWGNFIEQNATNSAPSYSYYYTVHAVVNRTASVRSRTRPSRTSPRHLGAAWSGGLSVRLRPSLPFSAESGMADGLRPGGRAESSPLQRG